MSLFIQYFFKYFLIFNILKKTFMIFLIFLKYFFKYFFNQTRIFLIAIRVTRIAIIMVKFWPSAVICSFQDFEQEKSV